MEIILPRDCDIEINRVIALPILGAETYEDLEQGGFFPCSSVDLLNFKGAYVDPVRHVLEASVFYDNESIDLGYDAPDLHKELLAKGVPEELMKYIPLKFSVVYEDDFIRTTATFGKDNYEYYFDATKRLLRSIFTPGGNNPITTVREFQYDSSGRCTGFITHGDHLTYVGYRQFYPGERSITCEQRIFKDAWFEKFPSTRHDLTPQEVSEAFKWEDYRNREAFRYSDGMRKGEFLVTHHRAMFREKELYGHVFNTYMFRDNKVYCSMSHRFTPKDDQHVKPRDERRAVHIPTCAYHYYNEEGDIVSMLFGGGHSVGFERTFDDEGRLLSYTRKRWNVITGDALTARRENLIEYIGTEHD